jgi:thiamine-phosphate pyrophosphorylase
MPGSPGHALICLVTNRRRLPEPADDNLVELVRRASLAGVGLIQLRERDLDDRRLESLARRVVAAVRGTPAKVVINDRVDVALAVGADGVHLRSDSVRVDRVRAIVPSGFLVGRSVHDPAETAAAAGADYLIAGTVYPSNSKPDGASTIGAAGLRAICTASRAPVLAIGGVTADKLGELAAAGAAGVAAIGLFSDSLANGDVRAGAELTRLAAQIHRAFAGGAPVDASHG